MVFDFVGKGLPESCTLIAEEEKVFLEQDKDSSLF